MTTLLVIVWGIFAAALVVIRGVRPRRTTSSRFELKRKGESDTLRRERLLDGVVAALRLIAGVLIVLIAALGIALWQWWGVLASFLVILFAAPLSRIPACARPIQQLYANYEPRLIDLIEKWPFIGWFMYEKHPRAELKLESKEHLLHLIESSGSLLSEEQRTIITHGIEWHTTTVETIMTPRSDIVSVKHDELLGPLVLDDLHRSGHNRFPVIKGTVDTIIGILDITELLEASAGKVSQTAEMAMQPQSLRVAAGDSLPVALQLLQKSHRHMLVVMAEDGTTAGLVTLSDITGSLLGKKA